MSKFTVVGGKPLCGKIDIHGSKNAVLPILAASILTEDQVILHNCPHLSDVENMIEILEYIGCRTKWEDDTLVIDPSGAEGCELPNLLAGRLRSSITMLGPMLARFGKTRIALPGGCDIGLRPIDFHLKGMSTLNVAIYEESGTVFCDAENIRGADVHLDYPSVGTTENIMMAALTAVGTTVIRNAAKEPEIVDLERFVNSMGARVFGAGTSTIIIRGVKKLHGTEHTVMPDRIVAGTLLVGAAITGGEVLLNNTCHEQVASVISKLRDAGCEFELKDESIKITAPRKPKSVGLIETLPYPGFPTDMQAQMAALQCVSTGTCILVENVFESRFKYTSELKKMGANITIKNQTAIIGGVPELNGANVSSCDLRGGAALTLAALAAKGTTNISDVHLIDRGYYKFEEMLSSLGADIVRR